MIIRQETQNDYGEIYNVVKAAFESAEHSDGNEQELVNALRKSESYVDKLALLAEVDGKTAGYIMFTKIKIGDATELALAPLAVLPEYQRKGVGTALIKEGHRIAKELGYNYSVVLGSEKYYPRFGYKKASEYNIKAPFDVPDENFMAFSLSEEKRNICGVVQYDAAFGI